MKNIYKTLFLSSALWALAGSALAQNPAVGAWEYVSTVTTIPKAQARGVDVSAIPDGGSIETRAEASVTRQRVYLFGADYYSFFGLDSNEPRTLRRDVDEGATGGPKLTNEQKLREYNPLDVEFGSYSVVGNEIQLKPILDKVPDNMLQDGSHDRSMVFEIDGNTMKIIRDTGVTIVDTYRLMD